ncbi:MAG: hypothetical protein ACJ8F7_16285, partial [Gemmataceae bacterium]
MLFRLLNTTRRPAVTPSRRAAYRPRVEALEGRLCPSGGLLDPTFGGGTGEVSFPWSTSNNAASVATQPQDGKIVSAGNVVTTGGTNEMSIVRLNLDGSLDTTFNKTGYVDLKVGVSAGANFVALQPDGKILVGGSAYPTTKALSGYVDDQFVVARLNSNGTLDSTFANKGIFTWDPSSSMQDWVQALAVLSDGSIAVLGQTNNLNQGGMVFKLSAGGARMSSFGSGGVTVLNPLYGTSLTGFAVAPNGDLIISGKGGNTSWNGVGLLFAVNPSTGGLDPGFNNGQGWLAASYPAGGITDFNAVTIQGNGIVVAGDYQIQGQGGFGLLARFSLAGALDTGFASGGYFAMSSAGGYFTNVAPEPDGSLVVEGTTGYLTVGHLTANGQPDTTFGDAGTGFTVLSGAIGSGLAIDASGRIVVSGHSGPNVTGQRMAFFARLTPPEAMIGSFTASANPATADGSETLTASNIANSSTITQVAFSYLDSSGNQQLLGYGTQTSPGVWTFTFTVSLTPGRYTVYAQAEDSAGV